MSRWYVYMVRCADDSLYTGITTDLERRITEHNESPTAAAYTRSRRPVQLVYSENCADRASASSRENKIKNLSRQQKLELINN